MQGAIKLYKTLVAELGIGHDKSSLNRMCGFFRVATIAVLT